MVVDLFYLQLQKGHTCLHVAALLGQPEIVKLLLRRGANVNVQSECFDVRRHNCFVHMNRQLSNAVYYKIVL